MIDKFFDFGKEKVGQGLAGEHCAHLETAVKVLGDVPDLNHLGHGEMIVSS